MLERSLQKISFPSTICSSSLIICRITWQFVTFPHKYLFSQDTPVWMGSQGCCQGGRHGQPLPSVPGRAGLVAALNTSTRWALSRRLCSPRGCSKHCHTVSSPGAGVSGVSFSHYVPSLPRVKPVPPGLGSLIFSSVNISSIFIFLYIAAFNTFSYQFSKSVIMRLRNLIYWLTP